MKYIKFFKKLQQKKLQRFIKNNKKLFIYEDEVRTLANFQAYGSFGIVGVELYNHKNEYRNVMVDFKHDVDKDSFMSTLYNIENGLLRIK